MAAQFVPLVSLVGYEYSVLVSLLVSTVGLTRTIARSDARGPTVTARASASAMDLLAWVATAGAIGLANMVRVRNCEPIAGVAYLLVFGAGAVPVVVATAEVARAIARGRWRYGVALGAVAAACLSTVAYLATEPAIVAYNAFAGYFAGSIYDESLVGFGRHLWFRGWNFACAALWLSVLAWRLDGWRPARVVAAVAALPAVAIWMYRGDLGLERSREWVRAELGGHVTTAHFEIWYDASRTDATRLSQLISDHEARWEELREFWGITPPARLHSYVYADSVQRGDYMGGRRTLVAKIWLGEMHITWDGLGDETLAHEMSHLFLADAGSGPFRLSSRGGIWPNMALVEGAATASAWGADDLSYHGWSAALDRLDMVPDLASTMGAVSFWSQPGPNAYTLAGSFCRWLIETRDVERFLAAYRDGDFEAAYGEPLPALVAEWTAFLGTIPLDDRQLESARYRFDRPSIFGTLCARSMATRFEEGERLLSRREMAEVRRCFESILADDPNNVRYRLRIAEAWAGAGEGDAATALARDVAAEERAGIQQRLRARDLLADLAWREGRTEEALSEYRALLGEPLSPDLERELLAKAQALEGRLVRPRTAEAVRRYLVDEPSPALAVSLVELAEAADVEDSALARYLVGIRLAGGGAGEVVLRLLGALDRSALEEAQLLRADRSLALHLSTLGRAGEACGAWQRLSDESRDGTEYREEAAMWLGRCRRGTMPEP